MPDAPLWLGRELRLLRTLVDVEAQDVADHAEIHRTLLSHIEAGRRPITPQRAARIIASIHALAAPRQDLPRGQESPAA